MTTVNTFITGTGSFVPDNVVTNEDMAKLVDTSDEWIRTRTGIKTRRLLRDEDNISTVDMSYEASLKALESAGLDASDLDLIVFATVTPDYRAPSAACVLQDRLKARSAFAFDVAAACAGSIYGLSIADKFIRSGQYKRALVIGAENMSKIVNWTDRNTCVLFGDAASAAIVEADNREGGIQGLDLYSDGSSHKTIYIKAGGSREPMTPEALERKEDRLVMNGRETFKHAVRALVDAGNAVLNKHGMQPDDISHVVMHQANIRIIETIADRLGIPMDKFVINIDRYGNSSSASLFVSFDEAKREGRLQPGDNVLMMAIGAGFVWGAGLYRC